ncbi:MAG: MFS transporter, partial [Elusimicrobia bacterium]|nr:MFS transporter [Elusimicrobiota bacterium]
MSGRYDVLRIRDFRLALLTRAFDGLANQMLGVAVAWLVFQLTHAPLPLGLIGLAEGLPFMAAALWAGRLADTGEKSRLIALGQAGVLSAALGFVLLAREPRPPLALVYLLMAWGGFCRSFQWASMTSYIQLVVPREDFPKAAAWSTGVFQAATIAGPALGGAVYALWGAEACFRLVALCFLAAAACAARMGALEVSAGGEARGLASFL